ncbi:rRNA pseudouridine synthase [Candidatus Peregrinibacteria bacterium]|nr:rRNA pseudouridine synthase [Candidatus Peregrinibacteria bacterium]MBI3816469.1 rRNA pseudouridine synthase [Candidatus Peregrinibacteria bacterium]
MQERLQKILSARGIASRRKAEEYIIQGMVKVNGTVATLGQKADPEHDHIEVDGKILQARREMLYYVMNKPVGVVTTSAQRPKGIKEGKVEPTIRDLLPAMFRGKIFPVGRLDKDSEGLLLFTNDGVLSYRLTHPKFNHEKEYEVTLNRSVPLAAIQKLEQGFLLDGSMTKPLKIAKVKPDVLHVTLTEGRNRQIRRMCQAVGFTVTKLKRVRIMTLEDHRLVSGSLRPLSDPEKIALLKAVGLPSAPL